MCKSAFGDRGYLYLTPLVSLPISTWGSRGEVVSVRESLDGGVAWAGASAFASDVSSSWVDERIPHSKSDLFRAWGRWDCKVSAAST